MSIQQPLSLTRFRLIAVNPQFNFMMVTNLLSLKKKVNLKIFNNEVGYICYSFLP